MSTATPHPFDLAIALESLPEPSPDLRPDLSPDAPQAQAATTTASPRRRRRGATSPSYMNMIGPFGGTTAAVMLNAALTDPLRLGDPVALTVNYAAALADGGFEIDAAPVRTNRSTQHWNMSLLQGDAVAATASAVFAQRRRTWSSAEAAAPHPMPDPESLARHDDARRPPWVRRYEMRFVAGGMPARFDGSEHPESQTCLWVRDDPPRPLDFASLAALCDTFFPRLFLRRRTVVPIGTVTLTTYFHADASTLAAIGTQRLIGTARGLAFRDGYCDQRGELWSAAGELLASTHQVMYYRE